MSRTIRRKNDVSAGRWGRDERDWTYETDKDHAKLNGGWSSFQAYDWKTRKRAGEIYWRYSDVAWGGERQVRKTGKDFKRGWWKYHSDKYSFFSGNKGPSYFMTGIQRSYRRDAKREIQRFVHTGDHEPMILSKPKREYWD